MTSLIRQFVRGIFAGIAMLGLLAKETPDFQREEQEIAEISVRIADELINALTGATDEL